jgi:hypothetical protein
MKKKSHQERLKSAAIVKYKYSLVTGTLDEGFRIVYQGVLKDLDVKEDEVDRYIAEHQEKLQQICADGD